MKSMASFKRGLVKVHESWKKGRYEQALQEVQQLLVEWPDNPRLLVMCADLMQLQDGRKFSANEAATLYRRAAELEGDLPAALVEWGHFQYSIEDDAKAAGRTFDKAIVACRSLLIEALLGRAKALAELGRAAEARSCLDEAYMLRLRDPGNMNSTESFEEVLDQLSEYHHAG